MSEILAMVLGTAFSLALVFGVIAYSGRGFEQARNAIENAISIPDGYVLDQDYTYMDRMGDNWFKWAMGFIKPDYVCTEYEKINEPWKCKTGYDYQPVRIWYNTKTQEMYQEGSSFKVLR